MSEIERLAARVAEFSSKADFWNNGVLIFLVMTALAAAGIVFCQRLAFVRAGQMASAQNDLDTAKERDARTERDRVRAELAAAETKAKEADARIAEAKRGAAEARLALEQFKAERSLSKEQQERIVAKLRPFAGQKFFFAVYPNPESLRLLGIFASMLKSAKWERVDSQIGDITINTDDGPAGQTYGSGVGVMVAPDTPDDDPSKVALMAIAHAIRSEGIPCPYMFNPQLAGKTPRAIAIVIGAKP
ncbi:MAG: hypothetical protein ACJ74Z_13835 [Bryobacteraceae bacterium]